MKIARESVVLGCIGVADLITTIIFIRHHGAQEANPLFEKCWQMGLPIFVLAKFLLLLGPILILEWARKRIPNFVLLATRGGICAYLVLYSAGVYRLNHEATQMIALSPAADVTYLPAPDRSYVQKLMAEVPPARRSYFHRWLDRHPGFRTSVPEQISQASTP